MGTVVSFTPQDMEVIRALARARNSPKMRTMGNTRELASQDGTSGDAYAAHVRGIKAEWAVAALVGGSIDTTISPRGNKQGNIIGPGWRGNAKYRTRRGWDYALKDERLASFYGQIGFLVWPAYLDGETTPIEVVGWISKVEFAERARPEMYIRGRSRLVVAPRVLHSMTETPTPDWTAPPTQTDLFGGVR